MLYGEGVMSISRITSQLNDLGGGSLKLSEGFRKGSGQKMYCVILSILETLKRRGMPLLENIRTVFREKTPALF